MTTNEVIDREIRDALASANADTRELEGDPVAAVRNRVSARRDRRRRGVVIAGASAFVVAAFSMSSIIGNGTRSEDVRAIDSSPVSPSHGDVLPSPPLDVRGDAAVVWSGREVVVWGGDVEAANMGLSGEDRTYADGAAFDPNTGRWRKMSASPLPASAATTEAVKVDEGIVFVRGRNAALWDPETDTWRSFDDAPTPVSDLSSTGSGAISFSGNALLDPVSGTWTTLPTPPLRLERPTSVWDGSDFVVIGGPSTPFTDAAAIAYNPGDEQWRRLPDPPNGLSAAALSADWDGERVIVVNYDMKAAAYDPDNEVWTPLPDVPARFSEWYPTLRSAGRYSVAFMAHAIVVLDDDDIWVPLPYTNVAYGRAVGGNGFTYGQAVGTDGADAIYAFGIEPGGETNVLSVIRPSVVSESPDQIQIGLYTADLPEHASVESATYSAGVPEPGESVRVEIRTSADTCVLVGGFGVEPIPKSVSESLNGLDWARDETGNTWRLHTSSTEALRINCDNADHSRTLANSVPAP